MSLPGSKFPEGIDPARYREIVYPVDEIGCPNMRRAVLSLLSSEQSAAVDCPGCGEIDTARIVIHDDTERIFILKDSACIAPASRKPL